MSLTVLVTASPVRSDPNPSVLDVTCASVRHRMPDARLVVGFDGAPPHLPVDRCAAYLEHAHGWDSRAWDAETVHMGTWHHQSGTLRAMLAATSDPVVLVVEHDTPLVGTTDLTRCEAAILSGQIDVVRLHHAERVYPEHEYLMYDTDPVDVGGLPVLRTRQWSQRPHLAPTGWYAGMLNRLIGPREGHVEDIVYHPVARAGWPTYRLGLYAATGPHDLMRSAHTDGRAGAEKVAEIV